MCDSGYFTRVSLWRLEWFNRRYGYFAGVAPGGLTVTKSRADAAATTCAWLGRQKG
jgi:hypothetical protein